MVNGCLASETLDYFELGKITGQMAAKVLKGEATPAELAVAIVSESQPVYNQAVLEKLNLTLPEDYADATNVAE